MAGPAADIAEVEARAIHDRLRTIDTHIDTGPGFATAALDPGVMTRAQVDLPGMRAGGLDAGFFIVYTSAWSAPILSRSRSPGLRARSMRSRPADGWLL
jgi:hypothetical protein